MIEFTVSGSKEDIFRSTPPESPPCTACVGTGLAGGPTRYEQSEILANTIIPTDEPNVNHAFNEVCYRLFDSPTFIDLGCAEGGYIKEVIDDGYFGIGVDGFPAFKNRGIEGWGKYPDHFFQLNFAKPMVVESEGIPLKFDVVTAWEVAEHLFEDEIDTFIKNLANLVKDEGMVLLTVSARADRGHFTIRPMEWWAEKFRKNGLVGNNALASNFSQEHLVRACWDSCIFFLVKQPSISKEGMLQLQNPRS